MGKKLIVYHSVSGRTEKLALEVSRVLKADLVKLNNREKSGPLLLKTPSILLQWGGLRRESHHIDISKYELIIIASPCWMYTISPPVKAFIQREDFDDKEVALFLTHGGDYRQTSMKFKSLLNKGKYLGMLAYQSHPSDYKLKNDIMTLGLSKYVSF